MPAPRVVGDSNVLISAFGFKGKPDEVLRAARKGELELYLSPFILEETRRILTRDKFSFDEMAVEEFLALVPYREIDPGPPRLRRSRDAKDNPVLECVEAARAELLITGDRDLLVLERHGEAIIKITPGGIITQIIDSTGDGVDGLGDAPDIAVDSAGNAYVPGVGTHNAFKVTPGGVITQIIDSAGDGVNGLSNPADIAVDSSDNVFVTGGSSSNAFKITPGGVITQIIDSTGDGVNGLFGGGDVAVDGSGNVYVTGGGSENAFKITPGGAITQIIDSTGDGIHGLALPGGRARVLRAGERAAPPGSPGPTDQVEGPGAAGSLRAALRPSSFPGNGSPLLAPGG